MARFEDGTACSIVVNESGQHHIKMPDGTLIPRIVWTRVYDGLPNEAAYVIVKIMVNLTPTDGN